MAKRNPFGLNAYDAIRDPDSMPLIMKRAIANLMMEYKTGKRAGGTASTLKDPGSDVERFVAAFNIISASFTRNNIIQGRKGTTTLTGRGQVLQDTMPQRDKKKRQAGLKKLKTLPQRERNAARANKKLSARRRLAFLDRILARLKADLEAGKIRERQT